MSRSNRRRLEQEAERLASTFEMWLEFEDWAPGFDPGDIDQFNMQIKLVDGRRYALDVWTYEGLEVARWEPEFVSPELLGQYTVPANLLVSKVSRPFMERVVREMILRGSLSEEWRIPDDDTDEVE